MGSADSSPALFDAAAVRRLLPMGACIEAIDRAMRAVSRDQVAAPQRLFAPLADGSGSLGLMPGSVLDPPFYGAKVIGLRPGNAERGLPVIRGLMLLFEHATGAPVAVIDGAELTAVRTAAASGLATRELARTGARTLGILGTGVQAGSHLEAMMAVRPVREVLVWGRSDEKARAFAERAAARHGVPVRPARCAEAAACDLVCTVTAAGEPVLEGSWLAEGAHVNLVGSHTPDAREVDGTALARSSVWVDQRSAAMAEAGDVLLAVEEGAVGEDCIVGEIGQVLEGSVRGRRDEREITVYESVGVVAQDLFAAAALLEASRREDAVS